MVFSKVSPLYDEAEYLLRQELRDLKSYKLILQALAEGKERVSETPSYTGLDKPLVSRHLIR